MGVGVGVRFFPRRGPKYWKSMENRRARGEQEHEKCDQTVKQLAEQSEALIIDYHTYYLTNVRPCVCLSVCHEIVSRNPGAPQNHTYYLTNVRPCVCLSVTRSFHGIPVLHKIRWCLKLLSFELALSSERAYC